MIDAERYLYRAPLVAPIAAPLIEDGGVLTEAGRILAVGRYQDLRNSDAEIVDYEEHILAPALINGHCHLELSYLAELGKKKSGALEGDITCWISNLLAAREKPIAEDEQMRVARQALAQLYASGCRVVADIGNQPESSTIGKDFKMQVNFFLELLGLSRQAEINGIEHLEKIPADMRCTGHSSYSTSPVLLQRIKQRANRHNQIFPIHIGETADEITFLANGTGKFRDFLINRGAWDNSFSHPGTGAIEYLDNIGVLDEKTLCVHAVHVTDDEIGLMVKRKANICLCPGSNRYMGAGKAPVRKFIDNGLTIALGSDSPASNSMLNLWQEMHLLMEDHPDLDPENVFHMATLGGAEALGVEKDFGALSPGKSSSFLAVHNRGASKKNIFEILTTVGTAAEIEWVE